MQYPGSPLTGQSPFPREHGAWAMLLQPFLGALIVYHRVTWTVAPAFASVVLIFLVREPLIILSRQRWIWRVPHTETADAKRFLAWELPLLAAAGIALGFVWQFYILAILGAAAALLTALAVFVTLRNRQRSIWFQAVSAAGLASSAVAVCFAIDGHIPAWGWWFWALHAAHFLTAILVVHARLDARIAARKGAAIAISRDVIFVQIAWFGAGIALIAARIPFYGAAAILSAAAHVFSLRVMGSPQALPLPMKTVGLRAMSLSIAFTLLVVTGSLLL